MRAEVVLERAEGLEAARISLAAASSEELPIDSPGVVTLGRDDVQTAELSDSVGEADVRSASGHIRRHGDPADFARARPMTDAERRALDEIQKLPATHVATSGELQARKDAELVGG